MGSDPQFEKLLLILFLPFLFMLHHLACWDLSSPTRDQTCALGNESAVLTTGIPGNSLFSFSEWTSWTPFLLLLEPLTTDGEAGPGDHAGAFSFSAGGQRSTACLSG